MSRIGIYLTLQNHHRCHNYITSYESVRKAKSSQYKLMKDHCITCEQGNIRTLYSRRVIMQYGSAAQFISYDIGRRAVTICQTKFGFWSTITKDDRIANVHGYLHRHLENALKETIKCDTFTPMIKKLYVIKRELSKN